MDGFEMANQVGTFTEPVISPTTAEQGSDQSGGYFASPVAETWTWHQVPEGPEISVNRHSDPVEDPAQDFAEFTFSDPVANSGFNEDRSFVSETETEDEMLKLPRYISEALYVEDLHPSTIDNSNNIMDLFNRRVGPCSLVKVIPKPPGTPGIPFCSAYVNFDTLENACRAWETLNYHEWMGQPIRIMFSNLNPVTRYNEDANIIVTGLEESIDSKFLHHRFCKYGAVVSSKVVVDLNGKSTGRAFIQFEDEIDAKRAIEVMNNEKLRGKKVYVGPFIRRKVYSQAGEMNRNPIDLNLAHNRHVEVVIPSQDLKNIESSPIGKIGSRDILLGSSSMSGKRLRDFRLGTSTNPAHDLRPEYLKVNNSGSGKTTSTAATQWRQGSGNAKEGEKNLRRGTKASRNLARRKFQMNQQMLKEKMSSSEYSSPIPVDLSKALSSEPWPPQPWSLETLKDRLSKSHCPEERLAMLGATLFPLVARHTKTLVSDVTNVLVNLDIVDIERIMNLSDEALHYKVEEVKEIISERIQAFAPPTFYDVHEVAARVDEKHVIFEEEFKDLPPRVPAPYASTPIPAPAPAGTPAPTDRAPTVNYKEFVVPSFPVPIVPEFLQAPVPSFLVPVVPEFPQAPVLPAFGLGIPVNVSFPLVPLPFLPQPLAQPWFPDSVLNYTGYRPQPGTGFYEPRVNHHVGDMYSLASALARSHVDHEDNAIAAEESADSMEELAYAERAQVVVEPRQLMMEAFARVGLSQIVEESEEQMEEFAQEERAQTVEESAELLEEFVLVERDQAVEESVELMEEFTHVERDEAVQESAVEQMEETAQEERDQVVEEFSEQTKEFDHEKRVLVVEESADSLEEFAHGEQTEAVEEYAELNDDLNEGLANVEQADHALEESAELMEEVVNEEQTQAVEKSAEPELEVAHVEN